MNDSDEREGKINLDLPSGSKTAQAKEGHELSWSSTWVVIISMVVTAATSLAGTWVAYHNQRAAIEAQSRQTVLQTTYLARQEAYSDFMDYVTRSFGDYTDAGGDTPEKKATRDEDFTSSERYLATIEPFVAVATTRTHLRSLVLYYFTFLLNTRDQLKADPYGGISDYLDYLAKFRDCLFPALFADYVQLK
ncbi:MAG: hypothetical protein ACYDHF_00415 [Candidatus Cryosericum sp.]